MSRAARWCLVLSAAILVSAGCSSHPCEKKLRRPDWDEAAGKPEQPYLPPPEAGLGCGAGSGDRAHLGCPRLLNGEAPLWANIQEVAHPSGPGYRVYLLTSTDGRHWSDPVAIAGAFSSLGLLITESALYLFGSTQIPVYTPYSVVTAFRTQDLEHWEGCAWNICREVNRGLVDTQPVWTEDGALRMWYYSVPNAPDGKPFDPAHREGIHTLAFADLLDGIFYARGVGLAGSDLADPSVVHFRGRWIMAATQSAHRVVLAESDDGEAFTLTGETLEGVSVPYLFVHDNAIHLVAQRYLDGAGPWPVLFTSPDGRNFSDRGPLLRGKPARGCSSPVVGRFLERWVMFCATPEG